MMPAVISKMHDASGMMHDACFKITDASCMISDTSCVINDSSCMMLQNFINKFNDYLIKNCGIHLMHYQYT